MKSSERNGTNAQSGTAPSAPHPAGPAIPASSALSLPLSLPDSADACPILILLLVHTVFCTLHLTACCEYCAGTLPHTSTAPPHRKHTAPSTLSRESLSCQQIFSSPRQYAHDDSSGHACSQLQTHTSTIWQPCPSRALICCCAGTIALILTSATATSSE